MTRVPRQPSHPIVGWGFAGLGLAGLVWTTVAYGLGCAQSGVAAWPVGSPQWAILDPLARTAAPMALAFVVGALLPLQRWADQPSHAVRLARWVTAVVLILLGTVWVLRLNRVGFASLWARHEVLGDFSLPAAVLENRVWSANIMLVLVIALLSLPLNRLVRAGLARTGMPRVHWSLWIGAGCWWVGLAAVALLAAGR